MQRVPTYDEFEGYFNTMTLEYLSFFVGAGFPDESVAAARRGRLDFVGADAGTIDVGPYQLAGSGMIFAAARSIGDAL